jgi:prepilin-type N-terminal cleavage/methylation domain-containing protein
MRRPCQTQTLRQLRLKGFTLIELLLSVTIMTVIIVALYAVFDHTQKALRSTVSQTDVLESGRAAMDLITSELEYMSASNERNVTNLHVRFNPLTPPSFQTLPGGATLSRTNLLQDFFFMSRFKNIWNGSSYHVVPIRTNDVVGTLFRFNTNSTLSLLVCSNLTSSLANYPTNDFQRVIDGVIHIPLRPFDARGNLLPVQDRTLTNPPNFFWNQNRFSFITNALPPYVEVELGILEPQILEQYRSMAPGAGVAFLKGNAGRVHLFRQRIPIRTALQ